MPKQKTHKGLKKRLKLTARGKLKYKHSCGGHLMRTKNAKRRRRLAKMVTMTGAFAKKMRPMLGG